MLIAGAEGANGLDAACGAIALLRKRKESRRERRPDSVWWEKVDSNHRSRRQQIYSLPPLATREFSHIFIVSAGLELVDGFEPPTC